MTLPLMDAMTAVNTLPLWDRYKQINTREPQHYDPLIWHWDSELAPLVDRISQEISMEDAERRVLLLTHPAFPAPSSPRPRCRPASRCWNPASRPTRTATRWPHCAW